MKKKKIFSIEDEMFKTEPLFIVGCSRDEAAKYLKKRFGAILNPDTGQNDSASVWHFHRAPWRVVWFKNFNRSKAEDLGEVAHELMHLVVRICEDKGISMKANHPETGEVLDEPPAYMIDFFMTQFLDKVK